MRDPKVIARLVALNVSRYAAEGGGPIPRQPRQHRMNYTQFRILCGVKHILDREQLEDIQRELGEIGFMMGRSAINEFVFQELVFIPAIVKLSVKRVVDLTTTPDEVVMAAFDLEFKPSVWVRPPVTIGVHNFDGE